MANLFIPYSAGRPASLTINGHRLLIISSDKNDLEQHLPMFGGDSLREMEDWGSRAEQEATLEELAGEVGGGVVVAPEELDLLEVIRNLESELPWIH